MRQSTILLAASLLSLALGACGGGGGGAGGGDEPASILLAEIKPGTLAFEFPPATVPDPFVNFTSSLAHEGVLDQSNVPESLLAELYAVPQVGTVRPVVPTSGSDALQDLALLLTNGDGQEAMGMRTTQSVDNDALGDTATESQVLVFNVPALGQDLIGYVITGFQFEVLNAQVVVANDGSPTFLADVRWLIHGFQTP